MVDTKIYQPLINAEEVLEILNEITIFAGFNEKQLYQLIRVEKVTYKKGGRVFLQDEMPTHIYIILKGTVKLIVDEEGTFFELVQFERGDCFGESALIGIMPHAATAEATEDTELIVLSRSALMKIYEMDKEIFSILIMNIAREVCRRLHKTDDVILHYVKTHS